MDLILKIASLWLLSRWYSLQIAWLDLQIWFYSGGEPTSE